MIQDVQSLFEAVQRGELPAEAAFARLSGLPVRDLGHTRLDVEREARCGVPEIVFAAGKTPQQTVEIARALLDEHGRFLATRVPDATAAALVDAFPALDWHERARCALLDRRRRRVERGRVLVLGAGTSDEPVADEAAITARFVGARTELLRDVGVAGLHRLLAHQDDLRASDALVVVAGMEGALPSVVAGLVDVPVVAVPTSVGYGASFGGLAALLAMLNSCAAGVTVVNIDNGFGAGFAAARIAARTGGRAE
ncbi:MAG: nickel pincer cofactor biosynthesis protein LarB [Planctomycetes bacterium]|nr:nickel pincer cofactor biosynthesis protein LarB [Planctomycetota bacterium]